MYSMNPWLTAAAYVVIATVIILVCRGLRRELATALDEYEATRSALPGASAGAYSANREDITARILTMKTARARRIKRDSEPQ
jgi:hypothetical protein